MNTIQFDKKVKCGPEFAALRILSNCDDLRVGNIWLTDETAANERLAFCRVEDIGEKASSEYGVVAGDYVMIDRLSTFAHTAPVCCCRYNNIICATDKLQSKFTPLRNMIFVEPDQKDAVKKVGNIVVPDSYDEKLSLGTITDMNVDIKDYPFKVGDRVMLTKGADNVSVNGRKIFIYKPDMLVCKIVED